MDVASLGSLVLLALVDSTSFGTLLIPIWFLIQPGPVRAGRVVVFLGTVALFYFGVGVAVALGADRFLPQLTRLLDSRPVLWGLLVIGVGMFFYSFRMNGSTKPLRTPPMEGSLLPLMGLALVAAAAEVTTMLPYLAAIGLITTSSMNAAQITATMAGYCLVMILPALVLLGVRMATGKRLMPVLTRFSQWLARSDMMGWVVGIVGFLLARYAAAELYLID
ncbi:GAP family protein [Actinoplanes sp. NPDC049802]|uniref:GAP family protein n=1 Tax=Actinoplanes sp. NPDC049802 TaxID=3154742 RepID=UPI003401398A